VLSSLTENMTSIFLKRKHSLPLLTSVWNRDFCMKTIIMRKGSALKAIITAMNFYCF